MGKPIRLIILDNELFRKGRPFQYADIRKTDPINLQEYYKAIQMMLESGEIFIADLPVSAGRRYVRSGKKASLLSMSWSKEKMDQYFD